MTSMKYEDILDKLRGVMRSNKLSQEVMAKEIGVLQKTLSYWLTGKVHPTAKKVIKITNQKGEKAVYQLAENTHACSEHIHIQCVKCGCLLHLDCDFMADITHHLKESHGFEINCESSTLYGLCEKCRE